MTQTNLHWGDDKLQWWAVREKKLKKRLQWLGAPCHHKPWSWIPRRACHHKWGTGPVLLGGFANWQGKWPLQISKLSDSGMTLMPMGGCQAVEYPWCMKICCCCRTETACCYHKQEVLFFLVCPEPNNRGYHPHYCIICKRKGHTTDRCW